MPTPGAVATVLNYGTIQSTGTGAIASPAVALVSGGSVTNHRLIESAGGRGISFYKESGAVTNLGSVVSTATGAHGIGIYLQAGGTVTNEAGAVIRAAGADGVLVESGRVTLDNHGTIEDFEKGGVGVYLGGVGTLTNGASGLITSSGSGVVVADAASRVTNLGSIRSVGSAPPRSSSSPAGPSPIAARSTAPTVPASPSTPRPVRSRIPARSSAPRSAHQGPRSICKTAAASSTFAAALSRAEPTPASW